MDTSSLMFPKPKDKKAVPKRSRTKECDISQKVKSIVWERDGYRCIFCNKAVPKGCANAHLVKRGQGGLGIEQNIFTACEKCHHEEDNGLNTQEYEKKAERYLKKIYGPKWNRKDLVFKK